jgi:hypothetical protein
MAEYFVATSEDGVRFKLNNDGSWQLDTTPANKECLRFRSSNWGDSVAKIKAVEGQDAVHETDDFLIYEAHVGGFPANLVFKFINGMFHSGWYSFKQEHSDTNDFLNDFESLKNLMTIKYGKEVEIKDYWFNDLFRNDYAERGMAISRGDHSIFIKWNDSETDITLQITGDNYEINLMLIYKSKRLQALADAASEREKLVGL